MTDADRIDTLEETVRQLRRELGMDQDRETLARVRVGLGLSDHPARLMLALHHAKTWITMDRLHLALPDRRGTRADDTIRVHVHNIRAKLGQDAILCRRDLGYTLGAPGVKAIRRALEAA
jgi:DNA-binding response OmpR family regulator